MKETSSIFPQLFTVDEVARVFRFTRAAIRRMIRAQELPAIRIGKEYRIPRQVVENILNPLTEKNLEAAAYGLWRGKKYPEGAQWVRHHRDTDTRTLEELLEELHP